ncbi:IS30 family transposase, partial [Nocardiopsis rhodophaea]
TEGRARRPKQARLAHPGLLRALVLARLADRWSPAQIAAWLKRAFPTETELHVSHETIYQAIYVQSRGSLRALLKRVAHGQEALRTRRAARRPQGRGARAGRGAKPWVEGLHISARPAEAADRAVPGHWEGDLLIGKDGASAIATLVERSTRYVVLCALPEGREAVAVAAALSAAAQRVPEHLRSSLLRSLAWDQGTEMARHAAFTVASGCPVFFCDPHSPWQRGSNENTNGLLRQYFPKGEFDFSAIGQQGLDRVAFELNTRPR